MIAPKERSEVHARVETFIRLIASGMLGEVFPKAPVVIESVTELPFNRLIGLQRGESEAQLLRLPDGGDFLNHLGTVHASALLSLAEASSGEFLLRYFGSREDLVPVVRRLEAKFRNPARGSVTSMVHGEPEAVQRMDADLAACGRALLTLAVELHDDANTHVLSATVEWFIQRRAVEQ